MEFIRVELNQTGFSDSQRTIYLKLKGKKEIPWEPRRSVMMTLKESIEKKAKEKE